MLILNTGAITQSLTRVQAAKFIRKARVGSWVVKRIGKNHFRFTGIYTGTKMEIGPNIRPTRPEDVAAWKEKFQC
jgi:hypothetical protein